MRFTNKDINASSAVTGFAAGIFAAIFYGTNPLGGAHGFGTLYQITPEGKVSVIHAFAGGADGAHPAAELIQAQDGTIYGVTRGDGVQSKGTLFQLAVKAP